MTTSLHRRVSDGDIGGTSSGADPPAQQGCSPHHMQWTAVSPREGRNDTHRHLAQCAFVPFGEEGLEFKCLFSLRGKPSSNDDTVA